MIPLDTIVMSASQRLEQRAVADQVLPQDDEHVGLELAGGDGDGEVGGVVVGPRDDAGAASIPASRRHAGVGAEARDHAMSGVARRVAPGRRW